MYSLASPQSRTAARALWAGLVLLPNFARAADVAPAAEPSSPAEGRSRVASAAIVVTGQRSQDRLRDSAQAIRVIDTREARRRATDAGELLARTEGVAFQRSGVLGSQTRLSLNGLTDDQIRVFLDGVPLEFSGFGLGLSSVPINWLSRIDVYRGVVPVQYGTDALGGAVDLITDQKSGDRSIGFSYAAGAFDTHQLALNTRVRNPRLGLVANSAVFFDSSQNDYVVDVDVAGSDGTPVAARVRRFHDAYRAAGASLEMGVVDRPWAKRLLARAFATRFDKELQHNINMTEPYGAARQAQTSYGATLRYEQPRLGRLPVGVWALFGYSKRRLDFTDMSAWPYDWFGNRLERQLDGTGELTRFASDQKQWEDRALGRVGVTIRVAEGQIVRALVSPDFTARAGREHLRVDPTRLDPLASDRRIFTTVSGLEYRVNAARDRFEAGLFAKRYSYRLSAHQVQTFDDSLRYVNESVARFGGGAAARLRVHPAALIKVSYEYATRLPRPDEVFGDGSQISPNLSLTPENSHNANLSARLERDLGAHAGVLTAELSGFLRDTRDMIVRLMTADRVHLRHSNVQAVRTLGVDGVLRWATPGEWLTLQANSTVQDQRNNSEAGSFRPFRGQRLPNRPWFFANASATVQWQEFGAPNAALSVSWFSRYVHGFLPGWRDTSERDSKNSVPAQLTHAVSLVYSVRGPVAVDCALDVTNITDERVFDVLGVQRPGRAAYFKTSLCWDCEPN